MEDSVHLRIVGFEVEPRSYFPGERVSEEFHTHRPLYLDDLRLLPEAEQKFQFSYTIRTINDSETMWSSRMEHYLLTGKDTIHIGSLLINLAVILL